MNQKKLMLINRSPTLVVRWDDEHYNRLIHFFTFFLAFVFFLSVLQMFFLFVFLWFHLFFLFFIHFGRISNQGGTKSLVGVGEGPERMSTPEVTALDWAEVAVP